MSGFFQLPDTHQRLFDEADRFARRELYPLAERMDREEWWPGDAFSAIGRAGWMGITVPQEHGGGRRSPRRGIGRAGVRALEPRAGIELGRAGDSLPRQHLPQRVAGAARARRDGDHYVLDGSKLYITNGPVADIVLVYAKIDKARGAHGISAFIVETDTPGFTVSQKLVKMGFRGSQTAELVFDGCRVPAANLLGEENRGVAIVMSGLDLERAMINPIALGIAERALDLCVEYAKTRQQFGNPIGSFQMVQSMLAEMYAATEAMRAVTWRTLAEAGRMEKHEGGRGEIHKLTAGSIMFVANTLNRVLDQAVQVHGGAGYIWESEINRLFRATKLLEIGAGTTEVRKMIIARELLGDL